MGGGRRRIWERLSRAGPAGAGGNVGAGAQFPKPGRQRRSYFISEQKEAEAAKEVGRAGKGQSWGLTAPKAPEQGGLRAKTVSSKHASNSGRSAQPTHRRGVKHSRPEEATTGSWNYELLEKRADQAQREG